MNSVFEVGRLGGVSLVGLILGGLSINPDDRLCLIGCFDFCRYWTCRNYLAEVRVISLPLPNNVLPPL